MKQALKVLKLINLALASYNLITSVIADKGEISNKTLYAAIMFVAAKIDS